MSDEVVTRRSVKEMTKVLNNRQSLPIALKTSEVKMKDIIQRASLNPQIIEDGQETDKPIENTSRINENQIENNTSENIEVNTTAYSDLEVACEAVEYCETEKEETPTICEDVTQTTDEVSKIADADVSTTIDVEVPNVPNDIYENINESVQVTNNVDEKPLTPIECKLSLKYNKPCTWNDEKSKFEEHCKTVHPYEYSFLNASVISWSNIKVLQDTLSVRKYEDEIFWTQHRVIDKDNKSMLYYTVLTEGNRDVYFYRVVFYMRGNPSKRMIFEESCMNVKEDIENIFKCRRCVAVPIDVISSYFNIQNDLISQIHCETIIMKNTDRGFTIANKFF